MLHNNVLQVKLVAPWDMPKLGKGGTLASRQALLHSLVVSHQTAFSAVVFRFWGCILPLICPK
jgi:hypothetical protein